MNDSPSPSARERLRVETSISHRNLESKIDWQRATSTPEHYLDLLRKFFLCVSAVEASVEKHLHSRPPHWEVRRKTAWLQADIAAINHELHLPDRLIIESTLSQPCFIDSHATAVGSVYVLEGSTLGAPMILRMILSQIPNTAAVQYFSAYGDQIGVLWKECIRWIDEQLIEDADICSAVHSANATFDFYGKVLANEN